MNKNKQLVVNMAASLFALVISIGINFILSPYIVEEVGAEAYGFVQLSNNLISYFSVLTIALNSMSSRFISVSVFSGDMASANEYYSSTFFSNVVLCLIFLPVFALGIFHIDILLNVSEGLVSDVQCLVAFMALNFLIGLLSTNLGVSYYVKNQLYRSSFINIAGYILRAILLIVLFTQFPAHIAYMGLVTLIVTGFTQICNIYYKKKLIPELRIRKQNFSLEKTKQLIFSGIWNSVTRIGSLLQEGLDLLITNLMLSATDMGVLAIAKIVPNAINTVLNTMISVFMPNLTELYAKGQKEELKADIKQSMKIIGMFINIPIAMLIGFGDVLFSLLYPTQDAQLIHILSVLTILPWAVIGQATIIHNIFTVVNKIKINSILVCLSGLLNVFVVYVLLNTTDLGLLAVAGMSTVFSIIRNLGYTVPFGAIYIGCPWYTFFPEIGKSVIAVIVISGMSILLKQFMTVASWGALVLLAVITGIIGFLFNGFLVLNKDDRMFLYKKIKK